MPDVASLAEGASLLAMLSAAFASGLLLSLTPCVYPMIPVTVAAFGAQRTSRSRTLGLAVLYVLGIAATYATLGVWAAATGQLFGSALADPRVPGAFAAVLGLAAAATFGWVPPMERALSRTPRWALRRGGVSPPGALAMGLLAGVVFAPCVGPFVVGVLAYVGSTGDLTLGGGLLAAVGLGMGAPFVVLAASARELARLPRPGGVSELARFALGALLLATALYYLHLAVAPELFRLVAAAAVGAVAAERAVAAWRPLRATAAPSPTERRLRAATAVAALGVAVALAAGAGLRAPGSAGDESIALAWRADLEDALIEAREDGRFAVVDFTAEWCLVCHELERVTFQDPRVARLLASAERVRVDATRMTPRVEALFERFRVLGLPAVVVLDPSGREVKDVRITSFVGPEEAVRRLREAGLRPAEATAAEEAAEGPSA